MMYVGMVVPKPTGVGMATYIIFAILISFVLCTYTCMYELCLYTEV